MANLSGSLSQVGSVVLLTEAATKFSEMAAAFSQANAGKTLTIIQGYMSEWDMYKEYYDNYVGALKSELENTVKPILDNATPTEADRTTLFNWFKNTGYNDYNYQNTPLAAAQSTWTHHKKFKCSWAHAYFADGTIIYGIPNNLDNDPRRTGRFILIGTGGDQSMLQWLFRNSFKYGFYWYGPLDGAFIYVGTNPLKEDKQKILTNLGMQTNFFGVIGAQTQTYPTTPDEVTRFVNSLEKTGTITNSSGETVDAVVCNGVTRPKTDFNWTGWTLVMNDIS